MLAKRKTVAEAVFHFYPDLNTFLAPTRRDGTFLCSFENGQSLKHLVEACGVPHTEVGQVLANERMVRFEYQVQHGDTISVYPAAAGDEPLPADLRFVLDNHLGRLAAYLRMLGFDVIYHPDYDDQVLAEISAGEERILLTRDRRLLMRKIVRYGYCPRSLESHQQVLEVLRRYNLAEKIAPFRRCLRCNHLLELVRKDEVLDRLEPLTRLYYDEFHRCPACGQVYWKGSHYERMLVLIERMRRDQAR